MNVSIIIPAHNAAETLAETLDSLLSQTYPHWEAIVVDDGSSDGTAAIAAGYAAQDTRIRTVSQPQMGIGAARNSGISLARFDWLLFLDADDWLMRQHLERLTSVLKDDPDLDAAYCGWARVASDGTLVDVQYSVKSGDLFAEFARTCVFAIHTCIIRRSLVETVGGFDTTLRVCEDWDLWQRVARTGAHFGAIDKVLAHYRMRPDSVSIDGLRLYTDGSRVIDRGHSHDPRVPNAHPKHINGQLANRLPNVKLYLACWSTGLMLGRGQNVQPLLDILNDERDPELDPHSIAEILFKTVPLAIGQSPIAWIELWPALEQKLDKILLALETQAQAAALARRTRIILEGMALEQAKSPRPVAIGVTYAHRVEVTRPIPDIRPPASIERLRCAVECEGAYIGTLELPVCDGLVPGYVLADAITAEFWWPILGWFFTHTVYRDLHIKREPEGLSVWRGKLHLATKVIEGERPFWPQLHDEIGWTVFLQEVWGHPDWPHEVFYDPQVFEGAQPRRRIEDGWLAVEVSEPLFDVELVDHQTLNVLLTVGGVALGVVRVPAEQNIVPAHKLLVTLTTESGLELCRAVVRETLVGKPITGPESLRTRLAAAMASTQHAGDSRATEIAANLGLEDVTKPSFIRVLNRALSPGEQGLLLSRRVSEVMGTSVSRRAALPTAAASALIDAASVAKEPVIYYPQPDNQPERTIYAPDLILDHRQYQPASATRTDEANTVPPEAGVQVSWSGESEITVSDHLLILTYHRIAPTGSSMTTRYRVTPTAFEEQLRYLHTAGYYSIGLEEWQAAMKFKNPLPGRPIYITSDDGYVDFLTYAWPLLQRYGFSVTIFLVTDEIGRSNRWDHVYGEEVPLLDWPEIRQLQAEGVAFGSHSASHPHLTALSPQRIVYEGAHSRAILERELGVACRAFAYPHGDVDPVVQHLIGACGYTFGLSCRPDVSRFQDKLLALPRIEVTGSDTLSDFIAKLDPNAKTV